MAADFTFGTLETGEQRLARLREQRRGVKHNYQIEPRDPLPGQAVTVWATVGSTVTANRLTLYYTDDGSEPQGGRGAATAGAAIEMEQVSAEWDVIHWGYLTRWRAEIPAQGEGTKVTYKMGAWSTRGGDEVFAENQANASSAATRFSYNVDSDRTPDWVWDSAIYHIFVDRFFPGNGKSFARVSKPTQLYGGTLRGIIDRLDYLSDLGANCLWLSPCFCSPSYHGYDIVDYLKVDPHLGTNQDLFDLVRLAHKGGIRVLLDFVPNHTSNRHPHFAEAQLDSSSPYSSWYTFRKWPHDYATFFTSKGLPQVNLENAEARRWMLDAARYWLELAGVDGYRLDYANGPSHDFWVDFRRATRAVAPESFMVGEVVEAADVVRSYEGRLDGALDFLLNDAARQFFGGDQLDAAHFDAFLSRHDAYFNRDFARPSFLDNHDMNRFSWIVQNDSTRLRLAATCQFTLSEPPIVYYGTEVGMRQGRDKRDPAGHGDAEVRRPMLWGDDQDRELLAFYRGLFHLRRSHPALRRGTRVPLFADASGVLVYGKVLGDERWVVALNNSSQARDVAVSLAPLGSGKECVLQDAFDQTRFQLEANGVHLTLAAQMARVLKAEGK